MREEMEFVQLELSEYFEINSRQKSTSACPAGERSLLEKMFGKVMDPVCICRNCLCEFCGNNLESVHVKAGEAKQFCYRCEDCRAFTGNGTDRVRRCEECERFVISEYAAGKMREKFKVL